LNYLAKLTVGLALVAAGLTAAEYGLYHLIDAGSCISNGDFLSDLSCFDNAGTWYEAIPVGLAIAGLGLLLFAMRGQPPDAQPGTRTLSAGVVGWAAALCASGFTLIWAVAGPDVDPSESVKLPGILFGAALIPVGLYPLLRDVRSMVEMRNAALLDPAAAAALDQTAAAPAWTPTPRPPSVQLPSQPTTAAASQPAGGNTPIERLNDLARRRDAGEITPEEFERQKGEILNDMTRGL
jgi:Short C-terminal domain